MFAKRHKGRELAIQALYALAFDKDISKDTEFKGIDWLDEEELSAIDPEAVIFAEYLVRGTIENIDTIDAAISRFSLNRPIERINAVDLAILRMSVYSLLFTKEVHPSIVIDEAVKLSRQFSTEVNYRYINGVLDAMCKSMKDDKR